MTQSDTEYIKQCLNGHADQYRFLVQRYQTVVMAFLTGRLRDPHRAEEAAQETFVRAYFSLDKLQKPGSFYPWMMGIADRVAKEELRRQFKQNEVARLTSEKLPTAEFSENYRLEQAIARLPDSFREIVLLRYYSGLNCSQVAEKLNKPLGTVTKMLSRAYGMLREILESRSDTEVSK